MLPVEKLAVVIPCLNEELTIGSLVTEVQKLIPSIVVIDDGSTDRTSQIARRAGAKVLRHDQPQGKGAALNAGWQHARQNGFEWVLCMDGDGQHLPSDIHSLLREAPAPLIVGNRMHAAQEMPLVRRIVNTWMSAQISRLVERRLPDTQCGFRLMHLESWAALKIDTTHFEIESDILLAFALAGHDIRFAPIEVIYKDEQSKIHPLRDTIRWFRWYGKAKRITRSMKRAVLPRKIAVLPIVK